MRVLQRVSILLFILILAVFGAVHLRSHFLTDREPPVFTSDGDTISISVHDPEEVLLAGLTAHDRQDGDLTDRIMIRNVSQLITDDTAKVSYIVFDAADNMAVYERTVAYTDYQRPVFTLDEPLIYQVGDTVTLLDRLRAEDVIDGDLTDRICVVSHNISTQYAGTYQVTVQVTNSMGDTATLPLKVILSDAGSSRSLIRLTDYVVYLEQGDPFDPARYVAETADSAELQIEASVNTEIPGTYPVLYSLQADGETYQTYLTVVVN